MAIRYTCDGCGFITHSQIKLAPVVIGSALGDSQEGETLPMLDRYYCLDCRKEILRAVDELSNP